MLPALSSVRQMLWDIEGFIISSQDWGKRIIVVKLFMAFESKPEWLEELFFSRILLGLNTVFDDQNLKKFTAEIFLYFILIKKLQFTYP